MKIRNTVRVISFLCAIILVLTGVIVKGAQKAESLELQIENNYSKRLNEFSASLNNISLLLKKARYATEASVLSKISAEILTEAEISKSALSQLPSTAKLEGLNLFLSQAGNYAFAISSKLYSGGQIPNDFSGNMRALGETADKVAAIVNNAQMNFDNSDYWIKEVERKIEENISESLSVNLQKIENELNDYPTLVYDGPYSDHLMTSTPEMLKNAQPITQSKAMEKAYKFSDQNTHLKPLADIKGDIEAYRFGNGDIDIAVSKMGGYVVYLRKARQVQKTILSYGQVLSKAKRFLSSQSLNNF